MSKILYITASPKSPNNSISLWVGKKFLTEYKKLNPSDEIIHINLNKEELPTIDEDTLNLWQKLKLGTPVNELLESERVKLEHFDKFAEQFISADKYIFVSPMFNHFLPNKLKSYLDTVSLIGKTVKYNSNGPIGLLKNKKALHIQSCGSIYNHGDIESSDFGHKYLKYIMKFLGAKSTDSIFIDGLDVYKDKRDFLKKQASKEAIQLAKTF